MSPILSGMYHPSSAAVEVRVQHVNLRGQTFSAQQVGWCWRRLLQGLAKTVMGVGDDSSGLGDTVGNHAMEGTGGR